MIKFLIWGLFLYIAYVIYKLLTRNKATGRSAAKKSDQDDAFSEMDIRDAEYEDVENEG